MTDEKAIAAVAALRVSLGFGALLAPGPTARLFGFPAEQQTPMARLLGRWFGVRELVLAALALDGHGGVRPLRGRRRRGRRELARRERRFAKLNAANDALDVAAMLVPVVKREGLDRPQAIGVPVAAAVSYAWLRVARRT
jgi:hypothetical protein